MRDSGTGNPHRVPLSIVAPGVVARALADEANALEAQPFDATPAADPTAARAAVSDGTVVAALLVDLRGTRDTLVLNPDRDKRLNAAVVNRVRAVETGRHRTLRLSKVGAGAGQQHAYDFVLAGSVLGFLLILVISLARGPVAPTPRLAARRTAVVGTLSLVAGLVLGVVPATSLPAAFPLVVGLGAVTVFGAALTTMALEALAGIAGLAVATALFAVLATPLLTRTDVYLLPTSWPQLTSWTHTVATLEMLDSLVFFEPAQALRPALVVLTWLLTAGAVLLTARRVRRLLGVPEPRRSSEAQVGAGPRQARPRLQLWRLRVLGAVLPLTAVLIVAVVLVPSRAPAAPVLPSRASETECVGTGAIENVRDLNRVAGRLRGGREFQGGDVGADVRLQDGRRLWVFGDTLRSQEFEGQRFVRNSMLVLGPGCLKVVLPADHGALIPDRRDGVGYWPMSIGRLERPGYDLVSVAAQRVRTTGTTAFSFENLGTSIAVFVVPRGQTPQLITKQDIGPDSSRRSRPTWGAASTVAGGWLYLYGTANSGKDFAFGFSLRVARVRPDEVLDSSAWRYWDGSGWVRDATRATELIAAMGGVSQTLSVFEDDGTWYALSKRDEFRGTDLTIWTAPSPTGPFTASPPLAKLPSDAVTGQLRYMPLAHPDLLPIKGSMVVSYSRNNTDPDAVVRNPLLYRPKFLRVKLP